MLFLPLLSAAMNWAKRRVYQMEGTGGCPESLVLASENPRTGIIWFQFSSADL